MTDLELAEQKLEEALEQLEQVENLVDDARANFERAFTEGYEKMEGWMDQGFKNLNEIKNLL